MYSHTQAHTRIRWKWDENKRKKKATTRMKWENWIKSFILLWSLSKGIETLWDEYALRSIHTYTRSQSVSQPANQTAHHHLQHPLEQQAEGLEETNVWEWLSWIQDEGKFDENFHINSLILNKWGTCFHHQRNSHRFLSSFLPLQEIYLFSHTLHSALKITQTHTGWVVR